MNAWVRGRLRGCIYDRNVTIFSVWEAMRTTCTARRYAATEMHSVPAAYLSRTIAQHAGDDVRLLRHVCWQPTPLGHIL